MELNVFVTGVITFFFLFLFFFFCGVINIVCCVAARSLTTLRYDPELRVCNCLDRASSTDCALGLSEGAAHR